MKKEYKLEQRMYYIMGIILLVNALLFTSATISTGRFPVGHDVILFGVSAMALCLGYLLPQFKAKDERSKIIRERGIFFSYFVLLGILLVLVYLFQFTSLELDGYQTVCIITALLMISTFISMVVISKRI